MTFRLHGKWVCTGSTAGAIWRHKGIMPRRGDAMTAVTVNQPQAQSRFMAVLAASIGNALEWFDFVVYGFFALTISKLFFPAGDETISLLLTFITFGVPFFMRPLGAIVLGGYADRHGRKATLVLTIGLMLLGTAVIA